MTLYKSPHRDECLTLSKDDLNTFVLLGVFFSSVAWRKTTLVSRGLEVKLAAPMRFEIL